ncbi:MAG: hypothetical protein ACT4PL_13440 [Phycisphaerales bacterium]
MDVTEHPTPRPTDEAVTATAAEPILAPCPPRRSRWRRAVKWAVVLLLGVAGLAIGLTQGPCAAWIARRTLAGITGCEADVTWASLQRDGRIVLSGVSLRAPGIEGKGGEIISCERVEAEFDWSDILSGDFMPTGVRFLRPLIRVSESDTGALNFAAVAAKAGTARSGPSSSEASGVATGVTRLPRIELLLGSVELGEHVDATGEYTPLARLTMGGWLDRTRTGDRSDYQIELREGAKVDPEGTPLEGPPAAFAQEAGVTVRGRFNARTQEGNAAVTGVALQDWNAERIPRAFRETWRRMDMKGRIATTTVAYNDAEGVRSTIAVENVSMNVPVEVDKTSAAASAGPRAWLSMDNVSGTITFRQRGKTTSGSGQRAGAGGIDARVRGLVEDLPLSVSLLTEGVDPDQSGFTCEIISDGFKMSRSSALLPFLPSLVNKRIASFSGPSAEMSARVVLKRESAGPEVPRPKLSVSGTVSFSKGRAAFEQFPYPIFDLSGLVMFDDTQVKIEQINGRGPTGATLLATGRIWPPEDAEYCDLRITVINAPIDEFLALALDARKELAGAILGAATPGGLDAVRGRDPAAGRNPVAILLGEETAARIYASERSWRMGLYDAVFSTQRHQELVRAGLIGTPERPFRFGGVISELTVNVHYAPETGGHYDTNVDVQFKDAGIVPQAFPLPIIASNLRVKIREAEATLEGDGFRTFGGGTGALEGRIDLTNPERTAAVPELRINATAVPLDDLLLNAIPSGSGAGLSPRETLRRLNAQGAIACAAHIFTNDSGEAGFDVTVDLAGIAARPLRTDGAPSALTIDGARGTLRATEREISVRDFSCDLNAQGRSDSPLKLRADVVSLFADRVRDRPATNSATFDLPAFDCAVPVEEAIAILSPQAATTIQELRATYRPEGRADALVTLRSATPLAGARPSYADDLPLNVTIETQQATGVGVNLLGGRLGMEQYGGTITAELLDLGTDRARTVFVPQSAVGSLTFDGVECGEWLVTGRAQLPDDMVGRSRWTLLAPLRVDVTDGVLESGVTRNIILSATSAETLAWFERSDVRGIFDADVTLKPGRTPADTWSVSGRLAPASFALTRRNTRVELAAVSGDITLVDSRGQFRGLEAATADWQIGIAGDFNLGAEGGTAWTIDADLTAAGIEVQRSLLALLPEPVENAFVGASMTVTDGFTLDRGRLFLKGPRGSADPTAADFDGVLSFQGLAADVGVTLKRGRGTLGILASLMQGESSARARLDLEFENVIAAGVPVAPAGATMVTGRSAGEINVPVIHGESAGGRLSGLARIDAPSPTEKTYSARINLAGVRFADLLSAFKATSALDLPEGEDGTLLIDGESAGSTLPPVETTPTAISRPQPTTGSGAEGDSTRGVLDAELAVFGRFGDPASKTGRGSLRIAGGDIVQLPLVLPLIDMSNFQLPSSEKLDFVHSSFHIRGSRLLFDELAILSSTVSMVGTGEMTLPEMTLDLRFNSQSRARLPLLSDVIEGLRNEIVTTTVRGTLAKPEIGASSFSATQRLLDSIFSGGQEQSARGLDGSSKAEQSAREQRARREAMDPPR